VWTVKEPVRRGRAQKGAKLQSAPIMTHRSLSLRQPQIYGPMLLGLAFNTMHAIGTLIWAPTFYARTYGWDPAWSVSIRSRPDFCLAVGSMFGSWLAERWAKQGKRRCNMRSWCG